MSNERYVAYFGKVRDLIRDYLDECAHPETSNIGNCMDLLEMILWQMHAIIEEKDPNQIEDYDEGQLFDEAIKTIRNM